MQLKSMFQRRLSLALVLILILGAVPTLAVEGRLQDAGSLHRDSNNMAIVNDPAVAANVPKNTNEAYVKWVSADSAKTNVVFAEGRMFVAAGGRNGIREIDPQTGETLRQSEGLNASIGFSYFLTAGGDKLFLQEGLQVEALYINDLSRAWVSEAVTGMGSHAGTQGLTQLYYADGYIYGGTTRGTASKADDGGVFFCMDAEDGAIVWEVPWARSAAYEEGDAYTSTGHYWAGPIVIGEYALIGGESGIVLSVEKETGKIAATFKTDPIMDIRSSITYADGSIYFSTKQGGYVYKVEFDAGNGSFGQAKRAKIVDDATESISAPTVYGGRVYVGTSAASGACVGVLTADALEPVYRIPTGGGKTYDVLLVVDETNTCVYGYVTYYNKPGSVTYFKDAPHQMEAEYEDFGMVTRPYAHQYGGAQVAVGPDGTLYFCNDTNKLIAVAVNHAYLTALSPDIGEFDEAFAPATPVYNLLVPHGTPHVELGFTAAEGASVTVNGSGAEGIATVGLMDGVATADIVVTHGDDTRTYQVNIRQRSNDASLSMAMQSFSSFVNHASEERITQLDDPHHNYRWHNEDGTEQRRLWVFLSDANATATATVLSGYATAMNGEAVPVGTVISGSTGTNTALGKYARYGVYFAENCADAVIMVTVTAEDGATSQEYFFQLTRTDDAYPNQAPILLRAAGERFDAENGRVTLTGDKAGSYYYSIVQPGAAAPVIDTQGEGIPVDHFGNVTIPLTNLTAGAKDVYLVLEDDSGAVSQPVAVSLPDALHSDTVRVRIEGSAANLYYGNVTVTAPGTGASVLDVLAHLDAVDDRIDMTIADTPYGKYISAINEEREGHFAEEGIYDGWQYIVNGQSPDVGIADYIVAEHDEILLYYGNYDALYPIVDTAKLDSTGQITFTAAVTDYIPQPVTTTQPIVGATVTWYNGQTPVIYTTDQDGTVTISHADRTVGVHGLQIEQYAESGRALVLRLAPDYSVTVERTGGEIQPPSDEISVTFRLLGDDAHGQGGSTHTLIKGNLTPWIGKTPVTLSEGATVGDVFQKVLDANGYTYVGLADHYIASITTPEGLTLAEFENGPNSGWMYTVNGTHPDLGLNEYVLSDGDAIVWHYTDDFTKEEGGEEWNPSTPPVVDESGSGSGNNNSGGSETGTDKPAEGENGETAQPADEWVNVFADVSAGDWFYDAVKYAVERQWMKGVREDSFAPSLLLTRGMLVTILYRREGEPVISAANPFDDVAGGQWYTDAVLWAKESGLVDGYGNRLFGTNDSITREQAATILLRYARLKGYDTAATADLAGYDDMGDISPWAIEAMEWANGKGLLVGRTETALAPKGGMTRAEAATLLMRFIRANA